MAVLKTRPTDGSVDAFIAAVANETRRADARVVCDLMGRITGEPAVMWGPSMVGFGRYAYTYDSGHSGEFFLTGFSPRKANLVCYIMPGYGEFDDEMARLGKHRAGKSCIYINKLCDIDLSVLGDLVEKSVAFVRTRYGV